jgi:drug/metabolite transporter (DMT)-like permease
MLDVPARSADRTWLVALAASLWGLSGLLREPLSQVMEPLAIVTAEHVVLVLLVSPWVPAAVRALLLVSTRTQLSVLVIGAGSSALATTMFTAAFRLGDPITPQVLQKLQPLFALLLAALLLGERVTPRFWLFAGPALVGAWLLSFPSPLDVGVQSLAAAALALGAATLWAAGTVLGRLVSAELSFMHVTTLRFLIGLLALVSFGWVSGAPVSVPASLIPSLVALAVIPGLLALAFYYLALRRTPASRATLAELAFPITAAFVGVTLLDASLDTSQWLGFGVVLASVVLLAMHEHSSRRPAVAVPNRAEEALMTD